MSFTDLPRLGEFEELARRRAPSWRSAPIGSGVGRWRIFGCAIGSFLLLLGPAASLAQQAQDGAAADPWAGIEEMIVIGEGAATLLTTQSTSAVAFDSSTLESYGVDDLGDIAAFVPNLEIRSQNATNASFFIRGVGLQDFGANASSAVPIIQDGLIRNPSATQLVGLFDVGGLSVLRGPQGSGNFRNASAGAIRIQTAKPEPNLSGFAQVTLAQISSKDAVDAPRYDFESAISSALYEDIVSIRISARYTHESPFVENRCANRVSMAARTVAANLNDPAAQLCETFTDVNSTGGIFGVDGERIPSNEISRVLPFLDKRLGEVDDYGFRAQLRIQPPDTGLDVIVRAEFSNLNRDSTTGAHIGTGIALGGFDTLGYRDGEISLRERQLLAMGVAPGDARNLIARELFRRGGDTRPYAVSLDTHGRTLLETLTLSMTIVNEFDDFDLEINGGYVDYRKSEARDTDLSPNRLFPSEGDDQAWEVYADFTLSGDSAGDVPIAWSAGGYTLLENVEGRLLQSLPTGATRENEFEQETYSFGAFVEGEYEFFEAITFAAGARYNWERKGFEVQDLQLTGFLRGIDASKNQLTWDSFSGFAEIRYDFTEEIGAYMKYSRGFKAGQFNPSRPDSAEIPGRGFADPEKIDSLEWGLNFGLWGGRVTGNGALFYYNYRNYQVFRLTNSNVGVFREVQNARKARNLGAEIELNLRPLEGFVPEAIEGLNINFLGGWLDTEFLEFTNVDRREIQGLQFNILIDNTGNPLIFAAQLQATLTVTWPVLLDRFGTITPQYDMSWTDDVPFDPNRGRGQVDLLGRSRYPPYTIGNRAYAIHNVRLTYEPPGERELRISGWCRNVTDERFDNFSVDLSSFASLQLRFPGDPRICGADIRYSW